MNCSAKISGSQVARVGQLGTLMTKLARLVWRSTISNLENTIHENRKLFLSPSKCNDINITVLYVSLLVNTSTGCERNVFMVLKKGEKYPYFETIAYLVLIP